MIRLLWLGTALGLLTACFEGFGALETTVTLDTDAQVFHVQRRVEGVSTAFLGCNTPDQCTEIIDRLKAFSPRPTGGPAERLMQRLLDSGAEDLRLEVVVDGPRVDAVIEYTAPLGSTAAEDTFVHAEWEGKGLRGDYTLTIDAQQSMAPPDRYRTRRVARSGAGGAEWVEQWVLPDRTLSTTTRMTVDPGHPALLTEMPSLAAVVGSPDGAPVPAPAPVAVASVAEPVPVPAASPVPAPVPAPVPVPAPSPVPPAPVAAPVPAPAAVAVPEPPPVAVVAPAPAPAWVPPDPESPARTFLYDVAVTGGALSVAAATQATMPLHPRIARCYQDRWAQDSTVQGTAFLSALVRPDGFVVSLSVFGQLQDRTLLTCLERASADWTFPAWSGSADNSEVTLPIVFRSDVLPPDGRKKKAR